MSEAFQVSGKNPAALFTLKIHRGDGMALVAMNWRKGKPPKDFVGFAIEYKEPGGVKFFSLKNRLSFPGENGAVGSDRLSTMVSPIQKFRWVHFPRNAEMAGDFVYKVTPVFMNAANERSYGEPQTAALQLRRETYPGKLNVTFTRGFVSSQAFVDRYESAGPISKLLPAKAADGLTFKSTHPKTDEALTWMGFEARSAILELLDRALADPKARVCAVAYDLSEPGIVTRLAKLKKRLRIIIDDSAEHGHKTSGESQAERILKGSAGKDNVIRQHMSNLQHNKTIVVDGPKVQGVVCGSTNFSWRGFFVQANNAVVLHGRNAVTPFKEAFEDYWSNTQGFGASRSARWRDLGLAGINASVAHSPHGPSNALLDKIAADIGKTSSSLFYSLAFLFQTQGSVRNAVQKVSGDKKIFVYGMSDKLVGGLDLQKPDGNISPVFPAALSKNVPRPFSAEPTGGGGIRMHHKFVVIDFDKPSARVYLGSYNFSKPADLSNGENLLLIRDRRVAVSYVVEAIRLFDHYHFRVVQQEAKTAKKQLHLRRPPRKPGEKAWWEEDYRDPRKIRDRELFA